MTGRVLVAALSAGFLLAGCSAKSAPPEAPESSPAPAAHGGLAECLKHHGVTDTGGPAAVLGPPAGVDPGAWDDAMRACSSLAPGPGPGNP